jgi:hypothetical protein
MGPASDSIQNRRMADKLKDTLASITAVQKTFFEQHLASFMVSPPDSKLGFVLTTKGKLPINGLRHPVADDTNGHRPHRVQLVLSVDNMNAKLSGRESLNGAAEPGRNLLEIDVFDGTKSVRAKNRCHASRLETADGTFIHFLKLFGPLRF